MAIINPIKIYILNGTKVAPEIAITTASPTNIVKNIVTNFD